MVSKLINVIIEAMLILAASFCTVITVQLAYTAFNLTPEEWATVNKVNFASIMICLPTIGAYLFFLSSKVK